MRLRSWRSALGAASVSLLLFAASVAPAAAANISWPQDANLQVGSITLVVLQGSSANSLVVNASTFQVVVAVGDTFHLRYPGYNAGTLAFTVNSGTAPASSCNIVGINNDVDVVGPADITFTPSTTLCPGAPQATGSSSSSTAPSVTMSVPNGGETLTAGAAYSVFWGSGGSGIQGARLSLSTDGGTTYATIADNLSNTGMYNWTVPSSATTTARMRVSLLGAGGSVLISDESNANFTIQWGTDSTGSSGGGGTVTSTTTDTTTTTTTTTTTDTGTFVDSTSTFPTGTNAPTPYTEEEKAAPVTDPNATGGTYSPDSAVEATPTIDVDKEILPPPPEKTLPCVGGDLLKIPTQTAVYYCAKNGKRYVFPNLKIYMTWFLDFSKVKVITLAEMAKIPIGGNVTYRPGIRMVKIQSDPKVYAIARDGLLRWVKTEAAALKLYGAKWNQMIDDVPDSFFFNYTIGDPIE